MSGSGNVNYGLDAAIRFFGPLRAGASRLAWASLDGELTRCSRMRFGQGSSGPLTPLSGMRQPVVQGRSLSGLPTAQMWVIRSPTTSNANTATVTPSR